MSEDMPFTGEIVSGHLQVRTVRARKWQIGFRLAGVRAGSHDEDGEGFWTVGGRF
jgi:hypothetical protein